MNRMQKCLKALVIVLNTNNRLNRDYCGNGKANGTFHRCRWHAFVAELDESLGAQAGDSQRLPAFSQCSHSVIF